MSGDEKRRVRPLASNRKAEHDYFILERYEAGLALWGTEVKSARMGRVQLKDGFVDFRNGEAFLVGIHISAYPHGNRENHLPDRERKLLLSRREIDRLAGRAQVKGLTVIPLALYLKGNKIKVEIGLAQGKKLHDRRAAAREKTLDREAEE